MSADLGIRIFLDDAASAGLGAFGSSLLGLGSIVGGLGHNFNTMSPLLQGAGLVAAGSGIMFGLFAEAIKYSVDAAAELQTALVSVELKVAGARDRADEMKDSLIRLANTSIYTTQEVADGFAELGAKGQDAADILGHGGVLGIAMVDLAESMGEKDGTAAAAKLLGTVLQQFQIPASQAAHVADVLDIAFHSGIPDVTQLTTAFANAAPAAHAAGIPMEQLAAYLDVLTQRMGTGSKASTALSQAISSVEKPNQQGG